MHLYKYVVIVFYQNNLQIFFSCFTLECHIMEVSWILHVDFNIVMTCYDQSQFMVLL